MRRRMNLSAFTFSRQPKRHLKAWLALLGQVYPLRHDLDDLLDLLDSRGVPTGFYRELAESRLMPCSSGTKGSARVTIRSTGKLRCRPAGALVRHVRDLLGTSGT